MQLSECWSTVRKAKLMQSSIDHAVVFFCCCCCIFFLRLIGFLKRYIVAAGWAAETWCGVWMNPVLFYYYFFFSPPESKKTTRTKPNFMVVFFLIKANFSLFKFLALIIYYISVIVMARKKGELSLSFHYMACSSYITKQRLQKQNKKRHTRRKININILFFQIGYYSLLCSPHSILLQLNISCGFFFYSLRVALQGLCSVF